MNQDRPGRQGWGRVRYPGELRALALTLVVTGGIAAAVMLSQIWLLVIPLALIALQVVYARVALTGSAVRLGAAQFPDIQSIMEECGHRLEMRRLPDCYIRYSPMFNASTSGFFRHVVTLYSALVEGYSPEELSFIIGHELGHEKFHHTRMSVLVGPLRQSRVPLLNFAFLFNYWGHRKEYTADRCGLLACRDLKAAVTALVKLSIGDALFRRMNIKEFLRQLADLERGRASRLGELWRTHPFTVRRVRQIVEFYYSETYRDLTGSEKGTGIEAGALPTFLRRDDFTLLQGAPEEERFGGVLDVTPGSAEQFRFRVIPEDGRLPDVPLVFERADDAAAVVCSGGDLTVNGTVTHQQLLADGDRIHVGDFRGIYRTMRA
ncbi:MAG: M48 family metallopeptidase [Pseudomonadota bacterium]